MTWRRMPLISIGLLAIWSLLSTVARSEDWPQWRGPQRNGISRETAWLSDWTDAGPPVAWTAQVGKGHSAVSVSGGRAYTVGWDGTNDTVWCFDAESGQILWKQSYACGPILQWPGPRATPAIHEGVVTTLGQHGQVRAWDAVTGQPLWKRDLSESCNPDVDYGMVWSPLIEGRLVILNAGARGLALDGKTGEIVWGDDQVRGACVSAVPYEHEGRRGVLIVNLNEARSSANLIGVDPATGRELWRWNGWQEQWGAMGVDPLVSEGQVFVTSAQEFRQAARFSIRGTSLVQDWATNRVAGYTGGAVLLDGHIYLVDARGLLKCIAWDTGRERWSQRGFDERGTLMAADGMLIIQTGASGRLVVVEARPDAYRERHQSVVFTDAPETFTMPVLANGRLYCRNYAGTVICLKAK